MQGSPPWAGRSAQRMRRDLASPFSRGATRLAGCSRQAGARACSGPSAAQRLPAARVKAGWALTKVVHAAQRGGGAEHGAAHHGVQQELKAVVVILGQAQDLHPGAAREAGRAGSGGALSSMPAPRAGRRLPAVAALRSMAPAHAPRFLLQQHRV